MFHAFGSKFDQDLGSWNVEDVKSMVSMFQEANSFTGKGLQHWNPKTCRKFGGMFFSNYGIGNPDLSNWNVEKAIQFDSMFSHSTFNGDVSNWKLSSTTNVQYMFVRATEFEGIGVGTWDVSGVRGVVFERSCRYRVSHFNAHFVVKSIRTPTRSNTTGTEF